MTRKKRRSFTAQQKADAVRRHLKDYIPVSPMANDLKTPEPGQSILPGGYSITDLGGRQLLALQCCRGELRLTTTKNDSAVVCRKGLAKRAMARKRAATWVDRSAPATDADHFQAKQGRLSLTTSTAGLGAERDNAAPFAGFALHRHIPAARPRSGTSDQNRSPTPSTPSASNRASSPPTERLQQ